MQLVASYNPDAEAPSQRQAMLDDVAFAIWRTWARVGDEEAARTRFGRLPPAVRQAFDREAEAAMRVIERARL